jgi:hypothetical protein
VQAKVKGYDMTLHLTSGLFQWYGQTSDIEKDQNLGHMLNFKLAQSSTKNPQKTASNGDK